MSKLFTELAEAMEDRQEVILNIKKIGGDLVIMVTPDLKKKGTVVQMTGSPEEVDLNFIAEFKKPVKTKTEFSAEVVSTEEEEESPKTSKSSKKKVVNRRASQAKGAKKVSVKAVVKKAAPKKAEVKKAVVKKATPAPKVEKAKAPEPVIDEKKIAEQAAADKLKADKATFEELMANGNKLYADRKYAEAEAAFKLAIALFPGDQKANLALANATKWLRAMQKADLL